MTPLCDETSTLKAPKRFYQPTRISPPQATTLQEAMTEAALQYAEAIPLPFSQSSSDLLGHQIEGGREHLVNGNHRGQDFGHYIHDSYHQQRQQSHLPYGHRQHYEPHHRMFCGPGLQAGASSGPVYNQLSPGMSLTRATTMDAYSTNQEDSLEYESFEGYGGSNQESHDDGVHPPAVMNQLLSLDTEEDPSFIRPAHSIPPLKPPVPPSAKHDENDCDNRTNGIGKKSRGTYSPEKDSVPEGGSGSSRGKVTRKRCSPTSSAGTPCNAAIAIGKSRAANVPGGGGGASRPVKGKSRMTHDNRGFKRLPEPGTANTTTKKSGPDKIKAEVALPRSHPKLPTVVPRPTGPGTVGRGRRPSPWV